MLNIMSITTYTASIPQFIHIFNFNVYNNNYTLVIQLVVLYIYAMPQCSYL